MKTTPLLSLILTLTLFFNVGAAEWEPIKVPGALDIKGTAWLRARVKVHDSFFTKHERNLFEESVGVNISELAGAHEV